MAITNVQVVSTVALQNVVTWDSDSITGTHFSIRFNTGNASPGITNTLLTTIEKTATKTYTHTGLNASKTYNYYVYSSTSDGTASGTESAIGSGQPESGKPEAPGLPTYVLSGTAGTDQNIAITWTAPTDLNGGVITGYRIHRAAPTWSSSDATILNAQDSEFEVVVADTGNTDVTYTDTTAGLNTIENGYFYRISAITAQGMGKWTFYSGTSVGSPPDALNLSVSRNLSARSINITWPLTVNDKNAGPIICRVKVTNVNDSTDFERTSWFALGTNTGSAIGGLDYGNTYEVRVDMRNTAGNTLMNPPSPNQFGMGGEPPAITDLAATAEYDSATEYTGKIVLDWSIEYKGDIDSNFSYKIYRDNTLMTTISGSDATLSDDYEDTTVVGGTEYTYKVVADNSYSSDPGVDSNSVTITASATAPTKIDTSDITVTTGQDGVSFTVSWSEPADNGSTITSYTINYYDSGGNSFELSTTSLSITITGLINDSEYTVRIKSANSIRDSQYSGWNDADTAGVPRQVSKPTAALSAPDIIVTWTTPDANLSAIIGYLLEYSTDSGTTWEEIDLSGTGVTYTFTDAEQGTSYIFRVKATNGVGDSYNWSTVSSTLTTGDVPDAPGISLLIVSRDEIDVTVTAPDDNGDAITSYEVQQRRGKYGAWETLTGLTLPGTITRDSLDYNALYYYRVSASNSYGAGSFSTVYGTTHKATGITKLTVDRKTPVTGTDVVLSWTTPIGYTDDEITNDSDKYYVYYLYDENKGLLHTSSSLTDKSVDPFSMGTRDKNKDYYFSVTFYVNNTSYYSTDLTKFNYNGPPDKPDVPITALRSDNTIDVYWYTPDSYSDSISTYDLRYSLDGGTTWESTLLSDAQSHSDGIEQHYSHTNVGYYLKGYTLSSLAANSSKDYETLYDAGNNSPLDLTGTSSTLWVLDVAELKLFAYTVADGARSASNDLPLHSDNNSPIGITTDGTTMWVADSFNVKLYAYTLSDNSRDTDKDINLDADNKSPRGLWSNSTHIYVLDYDLTVYCYLISDGSRVAANDITPEGDVLIVPVSIYSDGTTLWVSDSAGNKIYAFVLSDGSRDTSKDVDLDITPKGIHSDGTTLWVLGIPEHDYAYSVLATNDYGSSSYSDASAGLTILIPSALSSLEASAINENTVVLTWDAPDESELITSFEIERSADSGSTWEAIKKIASDIDFNLLTDGNVYTYTDTQLLSNTNYLYRVRASNTTGSGSYYESDTVNTLSLPGRSGKPIFSTNYQGNYRFGN